ncbi:MAG: hypothetical protein HY918_06135 [Candidatus Doudnabacteria bacterium]|nr:hypothetical protein [Candidatus Doudnabacteria bacterium]
MTNATIFFLSLLVAVPSGIAQERGKFTVIAWLHQNDWDAGLSSLESHSAQIAEVSPAWYQVQSNGALKNNPNAFVDDSRLLNDVKKNGFLLRPIISNVDASGSHPEWALPVLTNPTLRAALADNIVALVEAKNYAGVDIDIEGLLPKQLPVLADFVEELSAALRSKGKTVAVSLEPTMAQSALVSWKRIGVAADSVRLMLYGEHRASTAPGPSASLWWSRLRLQHILQAVPPEKLTVGVSIVALYWTKGNYRTGTWQRLVRPVQANSGALSRDTDSSAPIVRSGEGQVWFEDRQSLAARITMLKSLGLKKVALWRLGGEDPGIWQALSQEQ